MDLIQQIRSGSLNNAHSEERKATSLESEGDLAGSVSCLHRTALSLCEVLDKEVNRHHSPQLVDSLVAPNIVAQLRKVLRQQHRLFITYSREHESGSSVTEHVSKSNQSNSVTQEASPKSVHSRILSGGLSKQASPGGPKSLLDPEEQRKLLELLMEGRVNAMRKRRAEDDCARERGGDSCVGPSAPPSTELVLKQEGYGTADNRHLAPVSVSLTQMARKIEELTLEKKALQEIVLQLMEDKEQTSSAKRGGQKPLSSQKPCVNGPKSLNIDMVNLERQPEAYCSKSLLDKRSADYAAQDDIAGNGDLETNGLTRSGSDDLMTSQNRRGVVEYGDLPPLAEVKFEFPSATTSEY